MQTEFACSLCLESQQHTDTVGHVHFSPDETKLLTQSVDGTSKVWDVQTGELLLTFPSNDSASRLCCFSPCGGFIISSTEGGEDLTLHRAADGSLVASAANAFDGGGVDNDCCAATFTPDGARIAN